MISHQSRREERCGEREPPLRRGERELFRRGEREVFRRGERESFLGDRARFGERDLKHDAPQVKADEEQQRQDANI